VFNFRTESFGSSSVFAFYSLLFALYSFCIYLLELLLLKISLWLSFQINMADYPHFYLAKDGRLCSTSLKCPGFLRLLFDALIRLGYDGDALVYRCRLSMAHSGDVCECSVMIPVNPVEPWSGSVIGSEPDTAVEIMAHAALTHLSESHLTAIATLPIMLFPILNQENPVWQ
jgi:hypothetical protein